MGVNCNEISKAQSTGLKGSAHFRGDNSMNSCML